MGHIVLWLPLVWTLRFLLLVLTGGILYVSTLYLARFLRPENARALYSGSLPALTRSKAWGRRSRGMRRSMRNGTIVLLQSSNDWTSWRSACGS